MKKNLSLIIPTLLLVITLVGCGWITGTDGTIPDVVKPSDADAALYQQIAVPFVAYYQADDSITTETETSYNAAVTTWSSSGSTWDVYSTIAPPYVDYLNNDSTLGKDALNIRTDTVLSWKVFLESHAGAAPDHVFDPKANR